jgi:quercetin dioxygenase-like cupin family protein
MNPLHRFMRIIPANRPPSRCLDTRSTVVSETDQSVEGNKVMETKRNGSQPSGKGPAEYFTGTVRIDPLFHAPNPARASGASVTFEPGARTTWHTHPLGQTLIVTAGCGWAQRDGGLVEEIRPGDVIWFSARREALAWRDAENGDDAYCHPGSAERQSRRLDGARRRRTIRQVNPAIDSQE